MAPPERSGDIKTLTGASASFLRRYSPWMIGAAILAALAWRISIGGFGWADVAAITAMVVFYPFGEWAIHVYILHMKPIEVAGRRIDPPAARGHREHHQDPGDLTNLLFEPRELASLLLISVPLTVGIGVLIVEIFGSAALGPAVSAGIAGNVMIGVYEWMHYLIHTSYRPRSRYYRSVWRNHRLHHFKNEHFWHGITNNISDRVLGTNPEQGEVWRSDTARNLDAEPRETG